MKKLKLLTTTGLLIAGIGGQAFSSQAATVTHNQTLPGGNRVIIAYGSNCNTGNLETILGQLGNCFPNINLPGCNMPETETPDIETPETETPDTETPDTESPDTETPDTESPDTTHAFIKEVVNLVNVERAKEGLSPLTIDTKVQAAAMVRAKECEQSFSHTRPNGSSFATALKEQNVSYRQAGENIAWGQHSPKEVMNAWMNSSGHRANIMNPSFTTIGVGYYENANGTDYWCQLFTR